MNAGDVIALLRERYPSPEYAFFAGVADATGTGRSREADGLAMSCWPSRGLHLIGFEVKVSRSDWLREKKDPAKAEAICRYCDHWFVAAGQPEIVRPEELPPTWGLLEPKAGKLAIRREAPKLDAAPMTREFLASLLRNASDQSAYKRYVMSEASKARNEGYEQGRQFAERHAVGDYSRLKAEHERLLKVVADFEAASGIQLGGWTNGEKYGKAVKFIASGGLARFANALDSIDSLAQAFLRNVAEGRDVVAPFADPEALR